MYLLRFGGGFGNHPSRREKASKALFFHHLFFGGIRTALSRTHTRSEHALSHNLKKLKRGAGTPSNEIWDRGYDPFPFSFSFWRFILYIESIASNKVGYSGSSYVVSSGLGVEMISR